MREFAAALEKITASIAATYAKRTGQTIEKIQELMSDETWFTAAEAKAMGFADQVTEPVQMAARVRLDKFSKAPAALIAMNPAARATPKLGDPNRAPAADPDAVLARASKEQAEKSQEIARLCVQNKVPEMTAELLAELGPKPLEEVRAYFADVGTIHDICTAARLPQEAARFIRARMPVETVRDLRSERSRRMISLSLITRSIHLAGRRRRPRSTRPPFTLSATTQTHLSFQCSSR